MIVAIALAIILLLCAERFEDGAVTISDFVSFFTAMALLFSPIKRLTRVNALIQKGIAAATSVFAMIDASVEADTGSVTIPRAEGRVSIRSASAMTVTEDRCSMRYPSPSSRERRWPSSVRREVARRRLPA